MSRVATGWVAARLVLAPTDGWLHNGKAHREVREWAEKRRAGGMAGLDAEESRRRAARARRGDRPLRRICRPQTGEPPAGVGDAAGGQFRAGGRPRGRLAAGLGGSLGRDFGRAGIVAT